MCASDVKAQTRRTLGFSLVELLVAMAFIGILLAGMAQVFATSTASFMAGMETTAVQRNARWGLNLLQNDVLQAGLVFPPNPSINGLLAGPTFQPPLLMQATAYTPPGGTRPVDELQTVMDLPLNVQGTANGAIPFGVTTFTANIPYGANLLQAGDMLFFLDPAAEFPTIASVSVSGTTATITISQNETDSIDQNTGNQLNSISPGGGFKTGHVANVPFMVVRPAQVVRFTVVPRALDPQNSANLVPCLVRQARTLVPGEIWAPPLNTAPAGEQILMEDVVGFAVDWSLDAGQTWLRAGGAGDTWAAISTVVDTQIRNHSSAFVRGGGGVFTNAMWTQTTPVLIRLDLSIRSVVQRKEFNAALNPASPAATYRIRRETLLIQPRNCGIGSNN
jgi:hypothetical protein